MESIISNLTAPKGEQSLAMLQQSKSNRASHQARKKKQVFHTLQKSISQALEKWNYEELSSVAQDRRDQSQRNRSVKKPL